jgi:hypothetical protein
MCNSPRSLHLKLINYFKRGKLSMLINEFNTVFFNLIGYISIFFSVFSFISKDKDNILKFGLLSTILFGISISFYSGFNGLFVSIISASVKILSLLYNCQKFNFVLKILAPIISLIFFIFFNNEGIIGILPAIALLFIITADCQENILKMKFLYYGSVLSWLIYGIVLHSIPAILYDILGFIVLTYSIYKILLNENNLNFIRS